MLNGIEYDLKNPDDKREYMKHYARMYRLKYPERINEAATKWRLKNKDKFNEYRKRWYDALPQSRKDEIKERARTKAYVRYTYDDEAREKKLAYANNRYRTDAEFRTRVLEYHKRRYWEDAEFRTACRLYSTLYRQGCIIALVSIYQLVKKQHENE